MAEHELPAEQTEFYQWLEELGLEQGLTDLIGNTSEIELPQFSPEELEQLKALGQEYAQELFDHDMIPDLPSLDQDERGLGLEPEIDHESDRDR